MMRKTHDRTVLRWKAPGAAMPGSGGRAEAAPSGAARSGTVFLLPPLKVHDGKGDQVLALCGSGSQPPVVCFFSTQNAFISYQLLL